MKEPVLWDYTKEELMNGMDPQEYEELCAHYHTRPLHPVGQCFDATGKELATNELFVFNPTVKVIHGIGTATLKSQKGWKMAHAWIEFYDHTNRKTVVADCIWGFYCEAKEYREQLKIEYSVEYGRRDFMKRWKKKDFAGPWDNKIKRVILENQKRGLS